MMTDTADTVLLTGPEQDQCVLVAIDFSEDSKAALLWACDFAECSSVPLILLHVVHDLASNPGFLPPGKIGSPGINAGCCRIDDG